jgi:cytochrome oxidase Cu insertion factor (SCO1/SenC/PrrC family)
MPGMGTGLSANNPTIVAAFHAALVRQGLVGLILLAAVLLVWNILRASRLRAVHAGRAVAPILLAPEPAARRLLRFFFGCLWVFDGLLQAQPAMPLGMVADVVRPTASASPGWVQSIVNAGGTTWSYHPVTAAASAVWIQIGIGLLLLVAPRGLWSRLAGLGSVAWALVVWVFGETFGGIFAPGASFLFGTPGAVIFYAAAGVILTLPESYFVGERLGRLVLRVLGLFLLGMALLQAWPGRGFWQAGRNSQISSMTSTMATIPQPHTLSSSLQAFSSFAAANALAVNLFVVVLLALTGVLLLSGRAAFCKVAAVVLAVFCLATWVLVQDFGFFGGVGTDPNSMLPFLAVLGAGYLGLTRPAVALAGTPLATAGTLEKPALWLRRAVEERPSFVLRAAAALGAVGVVMLGSVPMAVASLNPTADAIVYKALDGSTAPTDSPATPFSLVDQHGKAVSLQSLSGRVVIVAFLDPVCTSDCPLIAQELRQLDGELGSTKDKVAIVAIATNPIYHSVSVVRAFTENEGMGRLPNWYFLTGPLLTLEKIWNAYGVQVAIEPAGAMIGHNDLLYVIDAHGYARYTLNSNPGDGAAASKSSFTGVLKAVVEKVLASK